MSSIGFTSHSKDNEVEKLREAWRSLNDLLKNLTNRELINGSCDSEDTNAKKKHECCCVP